MRSEKEIEEYVRSTMATMSDRQILEKIYVYLLTKDIMSTEIELEKMKIQKESYLREVTSSPSFCEIQQPIHY